MLRVSLITLIALCAASLSARYTIEVREASWSPSNSSMKQVYIGIKRTETVPFSGEIVLVAEQVDGDSSQYSLAISMEEGQKQGFYSIEIPGYGNRTGIVAELFKGSERLNPIAQEVLAENAQSMHGQSPIGFISRSRLSSLNSYMYFDLVEIPILSAPTNWRGLMGFRAIILNDDRISRAQARALINYATAGGTLIISPRTAASFNPETPAGKLLLVKSTSAPSLAKVGDFSALMQELSAVQRPDPGMDEESRRSRRRSRRGPPVEVPEEEVAVPEPIADVELETPAEDSPVTLWTQSGRAVAIDTVTGAKGLMSRARVGAGFVILLHIDISDSPFSVGGESVPTTALANLMTLVMERAGTAQPIASGLTHRELGNFTDIASKRIPGQAFMMITLFVYLLAAGLGLFFLARKIKRPEYYPLGLLVFAVLSVVIVFGGGELMKRSGDKVRAVRVVFADESTQQTALVDLVCSYHMDGETASLQSNTDTMFMLTGERLRKPGWDTPLFEMDVQGNETQFQLTDVERWQNIYHLHTTPQEDSGIKGMTIIEQDGNWKVTNNTGHDARCALIGINIGMKSVSGGLQWFFIDQLGDGQSKTLTRKDPPIPEQAELVQEMIEASAGDDADAMLALLDFDNGGWRFSSMSYRLTEIADYSSTNRNIGDFVVLGVLPNDAIAKKSLGSIDVDEDDVSQHIVIVSTGIVRD